MRLNFMPFFPVPFSFPDVVVPVRPILAQVPKDAGELDGITEAVGHVMKDAEFVGHIDIFSPNGEKPAHLLTYPGKPGPAPCPLQQ